MSGAGPIRICPCCRRAGITLADRKARAASGGLCICHLCNGRSKEVWLARLLASVLLYVGGLLLVCLLGAISAWAFASEAGWWVILPFLLVLQPLLRAVERMTVDLVPLVPDRP
jgi:hypothetical protein